jgi:hypothetical protein
MPVMLKWSGTFGSLIISDVFPALQFKNMHYGWGVFVKNIPTGPLIFISGFFLAMFF